MTKIEPLKVDADTAEIVRNMQDFSDAVAYSFAVPSLCAKPMPAPIVIGIDWAKGYGPNSNTGEKSDD